MTSLGHSAWSIRSESAQLFMCLKFDCWIPLLFSSETSVITIFLRWWQILWSLWDATKVYHSRGHRAGDDAAQLSYFRTQVQVLVCEQKWTLDIDYWFSPFQKSSLRLPAETELCKQASVCPQHYNKDPVHVWRGPQQRHAGKERVAFTSMGWGRGAILSLSLHSDEVLSSQYSEYVHHPPRSLDHAGQMLCQWATYRVFRSSIAYSTHAGTFLASPVWSLRWWWGNSIRLKSLSQMMPSWDAMPWN